MQSLGIIVRLEENPAKQLQRIHSAGFEYISVRSETENLFRIATLCKEAELNISAAFAPYDRMNTVWEPGDVGDSVIGELETQVEEVGRAGIDRLILRVTEDVPPFDITQEGLDRFRRLADFSKALGVHLCFENRCNGDFLKIVLSVCDSFHGFCWNVGNELLEEEPENYGEKYAERLLAVRLSDTYLSGENQGKPLPLDGEVDWFKTVITLAKNGFRGPYFADAFDPEEKYREMDEKDFLAEVYRRVRKICGQIDEIRREVAEQAKEEIQ